jgi:alkanesulfonate monooxygenase
MKINTNTKLRFHWMLPKGGEVKINKIQTPKEAARYRLDAPRNSSPANSPDMEGWQYFARKAEEAGIDSLLISFSCFEPDPVVVACALGGVTKKLKYIVAFRSGLMQPPAFVQQINTLSGLIDGRVLLNTVAGSSIKEQRSYGDFLDHDQRYDRAGDFLSVCNALWKNKNEVDFSGKHYQISKGKVFTPFKSSDRKTPEIFVSGHSEAARQLAVSQGTCWLRVIDTPEKLAPTVAKVRAQGIEVCLRLCIICRPTREEAISVINEILENTNSDEKDINLPVRNDSQMYQEAAKSSKGIWLNDNIWAGFTPHFGPVWTTLVGTPEQIVNAFMEYKKIGVSQFIISGWPELNELDIFGQEVLPAFRAAEKKIMVM